MGDEMLDRLRSSIRTVPDFPIEGIMFRDITPLLGEPGLLSEVTQRLVEDIARLGWEPDLIIGPEARGFIFGPLLADRLGCGFVPVRKPGKLPSSTRRVEYSLEYGSNVLEMHEDAIQPGQEVLIIDDLLATGGTISACVRLCEEAGAKVLGALFLIELVGLGAREAISPIQAHALLEYPA
ncbi:MAG: adenine phosphoribosyltransferase [Candidatus Thalassarchaeaceae archaeon]|jgi:adenine phosphoribosyltransferase|nr:adenine phosphoribosyltransferase [Euryarchaeota archaeon]MDP6220691.1 adenine phosphoribosyltransferase [Candidatus Thalassarchaeaceae archaeon]MBV43239.1 adenine phosphoribosyltransferase [Euryarchaeota archaeon]MDP7091312.1 adenine phosphoribosyltransferase [Candidatus Thalassarchaeaceae archaeon]MDP7257548.1 adenine phosphoribosyltransferase [Candidatus Thalassarchaeaceae archaeon]|tara:strand:+ start:3111 stop:3653 length:543 start_codon:yes stop_codon:yes gene_type:complete